MAKELSLKTEEKNLNDSDDANSSHNTFSSLPHEQDQSGHNSISVGSFPKGQISSSSEDMLIDDKVESKVKSSPQELSKSLQDDAPAVLSEEAPAVLSLDCESVDQVSATSSSNEFSFRNMKGSLELIQATESHSSASFTMPDSPNLSEKSNSLSFTPSASPVLALTSWLGSVGSNESKTPLVPNSSVESSISTTDIEPSSEMKSSSQDPSAANILFSISPKLLFEVDDSGYGGGPCSAGATAVLDFIAEVLADFVTEQIKISPTIEIILESVPLYIDADSVLVFQGLCLGRLMNFLERRLLRDDEENDKKLDKSRWSSNLDALCWMIVDRVYMGAFPQPAGVLRTLEFLLSMLQLANKDGRIEEAAPTGKVYCPSQEGAGNLKLTSTHFLKMPIV